MKKNRRRIISLTFMLSVILMTVVFVFASVNRNVVHPDNSET